MVVSQIVQLLFKGVDSGVNRTLDAIAAKGDKANKSLFSIDAILKTGFGVLAAEKTLRILGKIADETFRAAGMAEEWNKATKAIKEGFFEGLATGLGDTLKEIVLLLEDSAPTVREWGIAIGEGISFAIDTARELYNWLAEILGLQRATFGLSRDEAALRVDEIDRKLQRIQVSRRELATSGLGGVEQSAFADANLKEEGRLIQERATLEDLQRRYADLEARASATKVAQVTGANEATKALQQQEVATRKLAEAERKRAESYSASSGLQRGLEELIEKWRRLGDATRANVMAAGDAFQSGLTSALIEARENFNRLDRVAKNFFANLARELQALAARQLSSTIVSGIAGFFGGGAAAGAGAGAGGAPSSFGGGGTGPSMMGFGGGGGGGAGGGSPVIVHNHINLSRKLDLALIERQSLIVGLGSEAMATNRGGYRTAVQNAARR